MARKQNSRAKTRRGTARGRPTKVRRVKAPKPVNSTRRNARTGKHTLPTARAKSIARRRNSILATGKTAAKRRQVAKSKRTPSNGKRLTANPYREVAIREMNRGRSLTATARAINLSPKALESSLKQRGLLKRKGRRWITKDNRTRRVPVMTDGRFRVLAVRGYKEARLVGEHHNAVGQFVRTNDIDFIRPFRGRSVRAVSGRRYLLETDPNALHRIAAMDTLPFHEIYEITSRS